MAQRQCRNRAQSWCNHREPCPWSLWGQGGEQEPAKGWLGYSSQPPASAPSCKEGQCRARVVSVGLEGEGWLGSASLGIRRSFLSLRAGISSLWDDVNFLPYAWTAEGLFACERERGTPLTTAFKVSGISRLEIMDFFFFNLFISVSESSLVYLFLKLMAYTWSKMLKCWFQQITQIIKPNFNNALQHY